MSGYLAYFNCKAFRIMRPGGMQRSMGAFVGTRFVMPSGMIRLVTASEATGISMIVASRNQPAPVPNRTFYIAALYLNFRFGTDA
jgi:hypothetical protein